MFYHKTVIATLGYLNDGGACADSSNCHPEEAVIQRARLLPAIDGSSLLHFSQQVSVGDQHADRPSRNARQSAQHASNGVEKRSRCISAAAESVTLLFAFNSTVRSKIRENSFKIP